MTFYTGSVSALGVPQGGLEWEDSRADMKRDTAKLVLFCLLILSGAGCGYFRWRSPSAEEVQERTQRDSATNEALFSPGKSFLPK